MHTVVLGIVQGITEFLPISSSAHLLLIPYLFGWPESGLAFDVALNTGTFIAVLIYFFPTWWGLLVNGVVKRQAKELRLIYLLLLATLPAAIIGVVAEDLIVSALRLPVVAASMMILFALLLWMAEKFATLKRTMNELTWSQALLIGLAQAFALIPGVSRSGNTMTAGLLLGLTKEEAAQFSFLLIAPVSFGAALLQAPAMLAAPNTMDMVVGIGISFVVGLASIHFLLSFIKKYGFAPYVWYRILVGILFLLLIAWRS